MIAEDEQMRDRVVVVGASGGIGRALADQAAARGDVIRLSRPVIDVEDEASIAAAAEAFTAATARTLEMTHVVSATTTASRVYRLRAGPNTGTLYTNSNTSAARFGGVAACRMRVWEIAA
jgi:NAD(P)-dependent dehydrogenase (short-subunit alcohol dehydrogenase family)